MKKAKYRQLVDKYKKEIESLREDILALVGDDCMLKYQTHKRWEMILCMEDSIMFGKMSNHEKSQGIMTIIANLSGKNTPLDILKKEIKTGIFPIDANLGGFEFDFYKIFMDKVEEMEQSVETLGHA